MREESVEIRIRSCPHHLGKVLGFAGVPTPDSHHLTTGDFARSTRVCPADVPTAHDSEAKSHRLLE